ncbi:MAG: M6 family metalloprotease domain-containing protein [Armatimonadota bacterium]|nr:M6 family metalloprotease domain-containing protein [Armatimonadota bacterium]MDW8143137.1 M6 family metalloprotease domain-containing protein [Armatimonadota bacterium]
MVQPKTKRWWVTIWTVVSVFLLAASVFGQVNWCRTTEVTRMLMKHFGITDEKIRTFAEAQQRQAGRELPSLFYGGLGSSFYPTAGLVGTVRGIHILVRPNSPEIVPDPQHNAEYYRKLLFDESNPESLASFVKEASYGRCRLIGDSFGPITVNVAVTTTGNITHIQNYQTTAVLQSIIQQALSALDNFVDFTRYDSDNDGRVDLLFLTIASDPDTRPPNGNFLQDPTYGAFTVVWGKMRRVVQTIPPFATTNDGVIVDCAVYVHEVYSIYGCAAYAHEFGHVFGLPDLYSTSNLNQVDPGAWSLMATGCFFYPGRVTLNPMRPGGHPGHLDPWCKLMWGWVTPIEVTREFGTVTIPIWSEQPVAYRLWAFGSPVSDEYFMVVNRQLNGFDRWLPGTGLNIFHIDRSILGDAVLYFNNDVQRDPSRKGVDLVDADGRNDMDDARIQVQAFDWTNFGFAGFTRGNWGDDGDPFPGRTNNTKFDLLSTPPSLSYIGIDSGVRVIDIRPLPDGTVQATLRVATQPQAVILSPREGEIAYTTRPTLQVQFTAPMGAYADIDPSSITVLINGATLPITNPSAVFDEGRQTLVLPLVDPTDPTRSLPSGTHTVEVRARNRAGVDVTPSTVTFTILPFQLRAARTKSGYLLPFMISLPYNFQHESVPPERRKPSYVFGAPPLIARWGVVNAAGQQGYLRSGEFVEQLAPGRAYWLLLRNDVVLAIDAPDVDRAQPFRIANEPVWDLNNFDVGWQQIGNPYPFPVNSSAVQVMLKSGQVFSLQEAVQRGIIMGVVYHYSVTLDPPTYSAINVSDWVLQPFTGYWIYKFQPCSLVISPMPSSRSRSVERKVQPLLSLEILGERSELPYRISVTSGTETVPAPPAAPGMTAWAGFVKYGQNARSAEMPLMEIPAQTGKWWLVVNSTQPNQTVRLKWSSLSRNAPKAVLVDPLTHRSVNMNGVGEWTVTTDEQGKRQLLLNIGMPSDVPLRILDVKVTRMRGSSCLITGRLTSPATVQAEVRTLTGRLVKVLASSNEMRTQFQFIWDGRSADGQVLPSTPLLLRLSARDNLGRETQRVVVLR